jgi:methionine--tRNA ligase beta chain
MENKIPFSDFQKVKLKVGEILNAEPHPNADKLLVLTVDLGEEKRIIVAGLKKYYPPEELIGKKAIFAINLEPASLRGIESNGMILAAVSSDHNEVKILTVDGDMPAGTNIS